MTEIRSHRITYFLLTVILLGGWFIRTYRTDQILGFYYDQGRDALIIWDLWHKGDFFLIGPTTGIAGIFRGPFYYYLIAPFYLISGGNPLGPAYFLAFTTLLAVVLLYYLGAKIQDRATGLFAALLGSFSFYIMVASRWLSNPTPMLLLSVVVVWMLWVINKNISLKNRSNTLRLAWITLSFVSGMSLFHFGSAGEFFYFPAFAIFILWQLTKTKWKLSKVIDLTTLVLAIAAFLFTLAPQVVFDFIHDQILSNNIKKFFVDDESFKKNFWDVLQIRLPFYYDVFASKIFHWIRPREKVLLMVLAAAFIIRLPMMLKNDGIKIILILLVSPIIGLLFFQGNSGNVYDYYLTGYYLIFLLLVGIVLGQIWKFKIGKIFVLVFFYVFLSWNGMVTRYHIIAGVDGPQTVMYGNQKQAIDWLYQDAAGRDFSVDVYVPPVIPYSYTYLFTWYGPEKYGYKPSDEQIELLYTVYEVDPPHPERLDAWFVRQMGIGSVEEEVKFGGVSVQRRKRFM
ncbi:hypothetical protein IPM62_04770 [Candidatus Woesebacteria bacterium]|nr:MAG: hypothetical protein IPM62_04770 [Candidatus Woesebacteria bacterium]